MGELCTHIIDVLTSSRSDEELQNEVSVHMIRLLALADIRNAHRLRSSRGQLWEERNAQTYLSSFSGLFCCCCCCWGDGGGGGV